MISIVDYGVGNLFSLTSSFAAIGHDVRVSSDPETILGSEKIILPGVGAFCDAAEKLRKSGMDAVVKEAARRGTPLLGICLGMQLLFEKSYENGEYEGLGLLKGTIRPIAERIPADFKVPQIGWNSLEFTKDSPLLGRIGDGDYVYFVHSYHAADCDDSVIAVTDYGAKLTAAVARDNICGCQFHPEKSGDTGLNILRAFCEDI